MVCLFISVIISKRVQYIFKNELYTSHKSFLLYPQTVLRSYFRKNSSRVRTVCNR